MVPDEVNDGEQGSQNFVIPIYHVVLKIKKVKQKCCN